MSQKPKPTYRKAAGLYIEKAILKRVNDIALKALRKEEFTTFPVDLRTCEDIEKILNKNDIHNLEIEKTPKI